MTEKELIEQSKKISKNTLLELVGIEFTSVEENLVRAKMPVDSRTHQPLGLLHGGATAVLVESLGSMGSHIFLDTSKQSAVGIEINVNHLKSVKKGYVHATGELLHKGRKIHVWNVEVKDDDGRLIAVGRLTNMIIDI